MSQRICASWAGVRFNIRLVSSVVIVNSGIVSLNYRNQCTSKNRNNSLITQFKSCFTSCCDEERQDKSTSNSNVRLRIAAETDLKDKVVLITGASVGIGKATAWRFAELGSKLILISRREEKLEELKSEILSEYPNTKIFTSKRLKP